MSAFNSTIFIDKCQAQLNSCAYYQKLQALPKNQRWLTYAGLFLVSQIIVFGSLYLFFGRIAAIGLFASVLAGLATGLGALPAAFFKQVSNNLFNGLLGGAAGVMLAATSFFLLLPGMIEYGNELWPDKGLWVVAVGMLFGAFFLHLADNKLPHIHFNEDPGAHTESLQKIWLFIFAITIHNFPEGMSVGVSFGTGDMHKGIVLAIAIALQNIPEGLAVALPLVALGYNKWKAWNCNTNWLSRACRWPIGYYYGFGFFFRTTFCNGLCRWCNAVAVSPGRDDSLQKAQGNLPIRSAR